MNFIEKFNFIIIITINELMHNNDYNNAQFFN